MNITNIKQAIRYLLNQRKFSLIVIIGLSVGMAASFLIYSYVYYERSYDNFHKNGKDLYRVVVTNQQTSNPYKSPYSYAPQGPVGMSEVPEIINYVRLMAGPNILISASSIEQETTPFTIEDYYYADSSFFNLFTFPLIYGDPNNVLKEPGSIVISQTTALKLFGSINPLGKEVKVNDNNMSVITGVFKDIPKNSHLRFKVLFSLSSLDWVMGPNAWNNHSFFTYFLLKNSADPKTVESKITAAYLKENRAVNQSNCIWKLQPVVEAYLKTNDFTSKPEAFQFGDSRVVYFLSLIAILILCIAWINYLNLSTAKATERLKEIGVRKTNGAGKKHLLFQFYTESAFLNVISILFACAILLIAYTWFTHTLGFSFSLRQSKIFWFIIGVILVISFIIPGFISSLFLSSHNPFKTKFDSGSKASGNLLRNGLVIFQFMIIIVLMAGVLVVNRQLKYLHSVDLGFQKDQVLVINAPRIDFKNDKLLTFSDEVKKHAGVQDVTASVSIPGERFGSGNGGPTIKGMQEGETYFRVGRVMPNYLEFYGIKLIAGRSFDEGQGANNQSIIINEEGLKEFGLQNPNDAINKVVQWNGLECNIIGVTQSFHQQSLHITPEPMILYTMPFENKYNYVLVKVKANDIEKSIASIKGVFNTVFPNNPFDYFFLDNFFEQQYSKDIAFRKLFSFFSVITLIIGFIGLHGLTTFRLIKRTKEIGIHKVNGADIAEILTMINKDFVKWVAASFMIATPFAWFVLNNWLENFAYKTRLSWWIFVVAGILTLLLALLTVSIHSWKAARRNPVEALRYE